MSVFSSQSHTNLRAPRLELITEDGGSYVQVQSWGNIEGIRLLSMDRLIVHKLNELGSNHEYHLGELVLLRPKQYGGLILGRVYGEHILMEPFGKVVSMERWSIVGAILAVERDIGNGSPLALHAYGKSPRSSMATFEELILGHIPAFPQIYKPLRCPQLDSRLFSRSIGRAET